jgi:hypothetical protein
MQTMYNVQLDRRATLGLLKLKVFCEYIVLLTKCYGKIVGFPHASLHGASSNTCQSEQHV